MYQVEWWTFGWGVFLFFHVFSSDSVNARVLSVGINVPGNFTVEGCTDACFSNNYPLAGMEFATQCCTFGPHTCTHRSTD